MVQAKLEAGYVITEAEAAGRRAKQNGSGVERVALLPTSLTIPGAASVLGLVPRDVTTLVREGTLRATPPQRATCTSTATS